jgi:hypothetical protein
MCDKTLASSQKLADLYCQDCTTVPISTILLKLLVSLKASLPNLETAAAFDSCVRKVTESRRSSKKKLGRLRVTVKPSRQHTHRHNIGIVYVLHKLCIGMV